MANPPNADGLPKRCESCVLKYQRAGRRLENRYFTTLRLPSPSWFSRLILAKKDARWCYCWGLVSDRIRLNVLWIAVSLWCLGVNFFTAPEKPSLLLWYAGTMLTAWRGFSYKLHHRFIDHSICSPCARIFDWSFWFISSLLPAAKRGCQVGLAGVYLHLSMSDFRPLLSVLLLILWLGL